MAGKVVHISAMTHTGTDDKDRDNGVDVSIVTAKNEIIWSVTDFGKGLVYRNGDDNGWDLPTTRPVSLDELTGGTFWVTMSGDDGRWIAAFSAIAFTDDGAQFQLLSKTPYWGFASGHNDTHSAGLTVNQTSNAKRAQMPMKRNPKST